MIMRMDEGFAEIFWDSVDRNSLICLLAPQAAGLAGIQ